MHSPLRRHAPTVFLDFDGTISRVDVVDAILDRYADPLWMEVEEDWRAGRLGSRACLARQMALVRASASQMDSLVDAIDIDEGFVPLLEACDRAGSPVHIVSDGFDYCIRRILARLPPSSARLVARITICASHLEPAADGRWHTAFPFPGVTCEHGCATCKPAMMRALAPPGVPTIFVGDGLSDRHAVAEATTVFAKTSLAAHCATEGVVHTRFDGLADVAVGIEEYVRVRV